MDQLIRDKLAGNATVSTYTVGAKTLRNDHLSTNIVSPTASVSMILPDRPTTTQLSTTHGPSFDVASVFIGIAVTLALITIIQLSECSFLCF